MIGKTLAHYEITSQLGKGGMGEVYQAKDQKLGRDVAIKVLPEEFAKDTDRVARFQREAKLLASLNHPNIAAIYGLEESDKTNFLVLELVQGETLADQIKKGPIPVEESLKLALQIAEALEAAHEKGVIHRDLKPANIKVTLDGKVKVLDFGLAKAFAGEQAELNLSNSPTLSDAATQQGVILGTAAYMSPEQAKGKTVDKRTDIWAFGCVLFEMLTGQEAFQGEDITEILASVVKGGVNLDLLPANLHPRVREVIIRCLQKELKKRYQDIGDVRFELEHVLADPDRLFPPAESIHSKVAWKKILLPWLMLGLAVAGLVVALAKLYKANSNEVGVSRLVIPLLEGQRVETDIATTLLSLSPDGKKLVYSGIDRGKRRLFLRDIARDEAEMIAGTDGAYGPFFSLDGRFIGFFSGYYLKKIDLSGGAPVTLAVVPPVTRGASWGTDDTIVVTSDPNGTLMRFTSSGKYLGHVMEIKQGQGLSYRWPEFLPGGSAVLYTRDTGERLGEARIEVVSLDTGISKPLIEGATCARYAKSGHIIFARNGNLLAVPFDIDHLRILGDPVVLVKNVLVEPEGAAQFDISDNGTLVYISGGLRESLRNLVWVDRSGKIQQLTLPPRAYEVPSLSPDDRRVAVTINTGANSDIWMSDIYAGSTIRMTFDQNEDLAPLWALDGRRIAFSSEMSQSAPQLHWMPADRSANPEILVRAEEASKVDTPGSFSSDGKNLAFSSVDLNAGNLDQWTNCNVLIASQKDSKWSIKAFANSRFAEHSPAFSPDNRWIAYVSDESGVDQVYVQPFPGPGGKTMVSVDGGTEPVFNPGGRELFYRDGDTLMARAVNTSGAAFSVVNPPEKLFSVQSWFSHDIGLLGRNYAVFSDGKRFLMVQSRSNSSVTMLNIIMNLFEELKQRVPVK
jgi:serine/threonine protein kinase/Tol biopolymer transport system component